MGMRRLSIIYKESGSQPIYNEDETVSVVFNGETYNYRELREKLATAGHPFEAQNKLKSEIRPVFFYNYRLDLWHEGAVCYK
jgi:asparagine synthase (glutamine-hydrolysing)